MSVKQEEFTLEERARKTVDEINDLLKSHDLYADVYSTNFLDNHCEIAVVISRGDWKHDHIYISLLISKNLGLEEVREQVFTEDGSDCYTSDCYSSTHYFRFPSMQHSHKISDNLLLAF